MKARTRIFVGCEGASERSYVRWLQMLADQAGLWVHLDPQIAGGGDPLSIVTESISKLKAQERKKGRYRYRAILLDIDKIGESPNRDAQIAPLIAPLDITLLKQQYDHEGLLLRHFPRCHNLRPPKERSTIELRKRWPGYTKPVDAIALNHRFDHSSLENMFRGEPTFEVFLRPHILGLR